jgi:hypothetical protein
MNASSHHQLKQDLVEHLWKLKYGKWQQ